MRLPYILKAKHSVFYIRMLRFFRSFFPHESQPPLGMILESQV